MSVDEYNSVVQESVAVGRCSPAAIAVGLSRCVAPTKRDRSDAERAADVERSTTCRDSGRLGRTRAIRRRGADDERFAGSVPIFLRCSRVLLTSRFLPLDACDLSLVS